MSSFYQGLFLAPNVVASALKGAIFAANLFEKFNFNVIPDGKESRHDIIQAIEFGNPDCVIAFCKGIQAAAPVDSYLTPEPWDMPGYDAPVIMAVLLCQAHQLNLVQMDLLNHHMQCISRAV